MRKLWDIFEKLAFLYRPKARLKIGRSYNGKKSSFIAQGVVVFREWDPMDKRYYYWEEWELTGFEDYDSWVEYDHYTKKISIYEPIDIVERIEARNLRKGQNVTLTVDRVPTTGRVKESGIGTVAYLKGKMSYQLFKDDVIHYATIKTGDRKEISVEDYKINQKNEKDYYAGRVLSKKQQKSLFGKTLKPINWAAVWWALFFGLIILLPLIPQYETVCTPRIVTTNTSPTGDPRYQSNVITGQECRKVRVYGTGGGGVGK